MISTDLNLAAFSSSHTLLLCHDALSLKEQQHSSFGWFRLKLCFELLCSLLCLRTHYPYLSLSFDCLVQLKEALERHHVITYGSNRRSFGSVERPLRDTTAYPSSRTINSSSRLSFHTEATTRRSSFQSAQQSLYQDAESSAVFTDADDDYAHFDLDSDLELRSNRAPSRTDRSRTASPFEYVRPRSAASFTHASPAAIGASNMAARMNSHDVCRIRPSMLVQLLPQHPPLQLSVVRRSSSKRAIG